MFATCTSTISVHAFNNIQSSKPMLLSTASKYTQPILPLSQTSIDKSIGDV